MDDFDLVEARLFEPFGKGIGKRLGGERDDFGLPAGALCPAASETTS
jgi:hypothetical protein